MTFLELVKRTVAKSGAKVARPTTVVDQTGINLLFVEWVVEAWEALQRERLGVSWRSVRDQTLALTAGVDEYDIPESMESIRTDTVKIHLAGANESPLPFCRYEVWRATADKYTQDSGKPQHFTISPSDNRIVVWPTPDAAYTIRYEGLRKIQTFDYTDAAGAGTSDLLQPTGLEDEYHMAIVWVAVMYYAMHFEDGAKLVEARTNFFPFKKYFEERFMPIPTVETDSLYRLR